MISLFPESMQNRWYWRKNFDKSLYLSWKPEASPLLEDDIWENIVHATDDHIGYILGKITEDRYFSEHQIVVIYNLIVNTMMINDINLNNSYFKGKSLLIDSQLKLRRILSVVEEVLGHIKTKST